MNFEKGMYVRTENGIIEKTNQIYDRHKTDNIVVWLNGFGDGRSVFIDDFEELKYQSINARGFIKKEPSFNITDLIDEGDYVNGYKVIEVDFDAEEEKYIRVDKSQDGLKTILRLNDIKSIVTKEQFESMSYKVEG